MLKSLLTSRTALEELAVSLEHQSFKDERENITQNILSKKQSPFFFLMNNSLHTPCSQNLPLEK